MLERIRRLPSPALVISAIALIIAIGGGTYAIAALNSAKVKKIARKQADKEIKKKASGLSVAHAVSADSATNATHATTADSATDAGTVGGETVKKFFMKGPANTPETEILHLDGLSISAGCDGTAKPIVDASSDTTTSQLKVHGTGSGGVAFSSGWSTGSSGTAIGLTGGGLGSGTGTYSTAGGQVVSFSYSWDDPPTYGGQAVCTVVGQAIGG
jgi:hypothetical protein